MGAMVPPHWIPEDDVLLKNAVEAGASLESLAKGAVQFSRRFTVEELRDRWFSLLYDPVVSTEASPHMVKVEHSTFSNQSRPYNKLEGVKEMACSSGKRKAESIRKCYYAMRKRICNEPFDMIGINLISGPGYSNSGDGNELLSADCRIGHPVSNNLGIQAPDFDIRHHPFPEFGPHASESTSNCVTHSFGGVQNHGQDLNFGGNNVSHNLSYPFKAEISLTEDCSEVPGFGQSKEFPFCNLFEAGGLVNEGDGCSDFGGLPFRSYGCSPPLPEAQIWRTSQEVSAAGLPTQIGGRQTRGAFIISQAGNTNETEALASGVGHSNSNLEAPLSCDSMIDVTPITEDYFAELSNTLFDFTNDDELFMDTDGKDTINNSYFSNLGLLLLDSPNECELPGAGLGEAVVAADEQLVDTSGTQTGGSDNKELNLCYEHKVPDPQVASSVSITKGFGPEYRNGVICCTLNTEDPEIPSNDDVFLPFRFPSPTNSSGAHWRLQEPSYLVSSSVKESSSTRKANRGPHNQKASCVPSRNIGSSQPSGMALRYAIGDQGIKFELPRSNIQHAAVRNARNSQCPNLVNSANVNADNFTAGVGKGGAMEVEQEKNIDDKSHCPYPDKQKSSLDIIQSVQRIASGTMSGLEAKPEIQNDGSSNVDLSFQETVLPEPIDQTLMLDQEELRFENDYDVPYFSDVEAMILDMDLSPDEFDLFTSPEVKRYQHEETKRTIIRLEQAADAFTHRTMAGQDAFAVLYGRCSKHFITKPEVVLGRETEDIKVDIDLGREKNGGKISRRQATIKMDVRGMFRLKNIGKSSMHVNGKELAPGQSLSLPSGSLLEVKGFIFVFETDQRSIKQYLDSTVGRTAFSGS